MTEGLSVADKVIATCHAEDIRLGTCQSHTVPTPGQTVPFPYSYFSVVSSKRGSKKKHS